MNSLRYFDVGCDRCILVVSELAARQIPLDFMATLIIYDHGGWKSRGTVVQQSLCCREPGKLYRPSRLLSRCVITLIAACVQLEKESLSLILFQEIRRTRRYESNRISMIASYLALNRSFFSFLPSSRNICCFFFHFDLSFFSFSFLFLFFFAISRSTISPVYRYRVAEFREKIEERVCDALECR